MAITIRPATPEDAPALHTMNTAFNGETGVTVDDVRRSLLTGHEVILIAENDTSPAGFCCAQVHRSFCYPAPVAEVTEMYVFEPCRRQGCATQMLARLESLLLLQGVNELHLLTGINNHAAQATYRSAGFIPHAEQYMYKRLT